MSRLFISPGPEVVGYFDPAQAQEAAEVMASVASERLVRDDIDFFDKLESNGVSVDVHWLRPDIVPMHEPSGDSTETVEFYSRKWKKTEVDLWHFDTTEGDYVDEMPCSTLVGASLFPPVFLKGAVSIDRHYLDQGTGVPVFALEEVQAIIDEATMKGDLEPVTLADGLVVQAGPLALHRRTVPQDYVGARYFKRHFPRKDT